MLLEARKTFPTRPMCDLYALSSFLRGSSTSVTRTPLSRLFTLTHYGGYEKLTHAENRKKKCKGIELMRKLNYVDGIIFVLNLYYG